MKNSTPFTRLSWKQGNMLPHLSASASRWFFYKTVHWNFKYCGVQIENVSYWFIVIQSISNHVSWSHAFLIGFPTKISKLEIFNWISVEGLDTINRFCTLYFSLKLFTSPSTVTRDNGKITQKELSELLWLSHNSIQYCYISVKCQFLRDWYWTFNEKKW